MPLRAAMHAQQNVQPPCGVARGAHGVAHVRNYASAHVHKKTYKLMSGRGWYRQRGVAKQSLSAAWTDMGPECARAAAGAANGETCAAGALPKRVRAANARSRVHARQWHS